MLHVKAREPSRILVVTAHPDDVDFGAAGTVATWTEAGIDVTYCIVTDGAAGSADPTIDLAALPEIRQAEQRKAAAEVGVADLHFLGYPDGALELSMELRRDLSRVIRIVRPERVVAQSPERNWDRIRASHPDHLVAGEATLQAVYPDSRNPYAHPELLAEGLEPHVVEEVWLMASPRTGVGVDITSTIERKIAALLSHRSQIADPEKLTDVVRSWTSANATSLGLPEGHFAESFQVVDTR
jgi:LmbE family N-acetylglucosaminyl deacetylase